MGCFGSCYEDARKEAKELKYKNDVLKKALEIARKENADLVRDFNDIREDLAAVRDLSLDTEKDLKKANKSILQYERALKSDVDNTVKSIMKGALRLEYMADLVEKKYLTNVLTTVHDMVNSK